MMATLDVVQRASAAGKNLVITHESTFFSHQDNTEAFMNDPTYRYKLDFLKNRQMSVFHFTTTGTGADGTALRQE